LGFTVNNSTSRTWETQLSSIKIGTVSSRLGLEPTADDTSVAVTEEMPPLEGDDDTSLVEEVN
jgi:hypothetical protein